VLCHLHLQRSK